MVITHSVYVHIDRNLVLKTQFQLKLWNCVSFHNYNWNCVFISQAVCMAV